jgi:hypothetical protein
MAQCLSSEPEYLVTNNFIHPTRIYSVLTLWLTLVQVSGESTGKGREDQGRRILQAPFPTASILCPWGGAWGLCHVK